MRRFLFSTEEERMGESAVLFSAEKPLDPVEKRLTVALGARFFMEGGVESRIVGRQVANFIRRMEMGVPKLEVLSRLEGIAAGDPYNEKAFESLLGLLASFQKPATTFS